MTARRRTRGELSVKSLEFLEVVIHVIEELRPYWPLTLRQIYYQLVARELIGNCRNEYQRLSRLLTKARLDGLVQWAAIEDRSRRTLWSGGWSDARGRGPSRGGGSGAGRRLGRGNRTGRWPRSSPWEGS